MMGDIADKADRLIEEHNEDSIAAVRRKIKSGPSCSECIECGADIPEARQALGGVVYCVDCQDYHERKAGK